MAVKPIAHSYWRSIKRGKRTFESIPDNVKADVIVLAKTDVENGVITEAEYYEYIGEVYVAESEE